MAHWYTVEEAAARWQGSPDNATLLELLDVAQGEVIAYAPALDPEAVEPLDPEDEDSPEVQSIPDGYRWAHLEHARNIWNASIVTPSGSFSDEGTFQIRPFPLDWAIKQRLRPAALFGGVTG